MLAYSGNYRVEGGDFITRVDASWSEEWNGTEQRRHFRIEGDRLCVESAPAPSITFPGKTDYRSMMWQGERVRRRAGQPKPSRSLLFTRRFDADVQSDRATRLRKC